MSLIPSRLKPPSFRLRKSARALFSPGGRFLAQIGARVMIWDVVARKAASEIKALSNEWELAFSPDERLIAIKNSNGRIAICEVATGNVICDTGPSNLYGAGCNPVFLADGKHLLDGTWDGELRVLEVATGAIVDRRAFGKGFMCRGLSTCPVSAAVYLNLAAKAEQRGGGRLLLLHELPALEREEHIAPPTRNLAEGRGWRHIDHLAVSPDGQSAAVFLEGKTLELPNSIEAFRLDGSRTLTATLESRRHHVRGLAWSKAGVIAASVWHNVPTEKPGFNAFLAASAAGILEHVHFYAADSMEIVQRWGWKDAWDIAFDPATDALVIASRGQPGAYLDRAVWLGSSGADPKRAGGN